MQLTGITPGDIVECDVRGRIFLATVQENVSGKRELKIKPIPKQINYYTVSANQVKTWYKKMGRSSGAKPNGNGDSKENPFITRAKERAASKA